jgi:hypothetical protein
VAVLQATNFMGRFRMRIVMAAVIAGGLALAGCSQETQDSAQQAAKSAAEDAASNTSEVLDKGAEALGEAADKVDNDTDGSSSTTATSDGVTTTTTTTTTTSN